MITNRKWIHAVLLTVALVQLSSCGSTQFQMVICIATGGNWSTHIIHGNPVYWCDRGSPASGTPTSNSQVTPTSNPTCNAYASVSVQVTLLNDGPGTEGTRDCDYMLEVTNISDQELILSKHFYIYDPANLDDPAKAPRWVHVFIQPGETHRQLGSYLVYGRGHSHEGEYYTWYTDRIAVTYPSCHDQYDIYNITDAVIEPYAQPVEFYCAP